MHQSENSTGTASVIDSPAWLKELRIVGTWIQNHSVLLGTSAILLPSISIYHYTMREHVPLSIASPDIISSLPSVLAAIAFLVLALTAVLLIPVLLILEGATRDADGRLRIHPQTAFQRKKDVLNWLFVLMIPGASIALGVCVNALLLPDASWLIPVIAILASLFFTWKVRRKKGNNPLLFNLDGTLIAALISFLQMLIAVFLMLAILKIFGKSPSNFQAIVALAISVSLLPLLQLFSVTLIELSSHRYGFVMQAFIGALCLVSLMCILPQSGAFLAGHVIGGSASGYTKCTQLRLNMQDKDFSELLVPNSHSTIPLKILSNAAGIYLARKSDSADSTVYRIPEASVIALSPCPSDKHKQ